MDYRSIVKECFATDEDLISKWHITSGQGLDACVDNTVDQFDKFVNFKFIPFNEGFIGIENQLFLSTFCIKKEFRNKETVEKFWKLVKENMKSKSFYSSVYKKNVPAIKFFERNNGKIINSGVHNENEFLVFEFKEL